MGDTFKGVGESISDFLGAPVNAVSDLASGNFGGNLVDTVTGDPVLNPFVTATNADIGNFGPGVQAASQGAEDIAAGAASTFFTGSPAPGVAAANGLHTLLNTGLATGTPNLGAAAESAAIGGAASEAGSLALGSSGIGGATGGGAGGAAAPTSLGTDVSGTSAPALGGATGATAPNDLLTTDLGGISGPSSAIGGAPATAAGSSGVSGGDISVPNVPEPPGGGSGSSTPPIAANTSTAGAGPTPFNQGDLTPSLGGAQPLSTIAAGAQPPAGLSLNPGDTAEFGSTNPAGVATQQNAVASALGNGNVGTTTAPATSGGTTAGAAAGGATKSGLLNQDILGLGINAKEAIGPLISGGGLLFNAINAANAPKAQNSTALSNELNQQAEQLTSQAAQLTAPLATGNLPPGIGSQVDNAANAAKAQIRQRFANMGLSGSSMEADELRNIDLAVPGQKMAIAQQLATTGLSEIGIGDQVFGNLLNEALNKDQQFNTAIQNFATAAAGGGGNAITLRAS